MWHGINSHATLYYLPIQHGTMRLHIVAMIIMLIVNILIDGYIYIALVSEFKRKIWARLQLSTAIALTIMAIAVFFMPIRSGSDAALRATTWMLFTYLSVYLPKYLYLIFDILSRLPQLFKHKRFKPLSIIGAILSVLMFLTIWWGAIFNRFNIDIVEVPYISNDLPKSFNNYKAVQISDLHVGSYGNDTTFVSRLVDSINALHPDVIFFTGDIVNRNSGELKPFIPALSRLKAKDGVYSVLGNHDYGDYTNWDTKQAKAANLKELKDMQQAMGWKMLNNSHDYIRRGADSIVIIGVENIGDPPFATYGNLKKAYQDTSDNNFKILLSHNPAHWNDSIKDHRGQNIQLTLSGHTHAMQVAFGRISPAVFRYKTWGGMYSDQQDKKLYVNIGTGTVGFPARIGATPEITLFTFHNSTDKDQ
jgi:predicted MPP superfamily phosphohydrolase